MNLPTQLPPVSVMDTTLRDGEQTPLVSYTADDKLRIARCLLSEVQVDRVEVASAGSSDGEARACRHIAAWARDAGVLDRIEVLGFCDGARSPGWIHDVGLAAVNLLCKGSERHCREQLGLSPAAHLARAVDTLGHARALGLRVSAYLEDWSRGMADSPGYVMEMATGLVAAGVERLYLADTLGCLSPWDAGRHVAAMAERFDVVLEFHGHDDYGLATANCLAAVQAGASGVHTCVNGLGERAGNARLAEVVVALHDHCHRPTGVREGRLLAVSQLVERLSGKRVAENAPVVGRDAFTQTAGIHADGDRKAGLYLTPLSAERFGRSSEYALGKLAGRASLEQNLERLGIVLSPSALSRLLARVVALGDDKRPVTADDLPHLVEDVLGRR